MDRWLPILAGVMGLVTGLAPWVYERRNRRGKIDSEALHESAQADLAHASAADQLTGRAMLLLAEVENLWRSRLEDCETRHGACAEEIARLVEERNRLRRRLEDPDAHN